MLGVQGWRAWGFQGLWAIVGVLQEARLARQKEQKKALAAAQGVSVSLLTGPAGVVWRSDRRRPRRRRRPRPRPGGRRAALGSFFFSL